MKITKKYQDNKLKWITYRDKYRFNIRNNFGTFKINKYIKVSTDKKPIILHDRSTVHIYPNIFINNCNTMYKELYDFVAILEMDNSYIDKNIESDNIVNLD